LLVPGGNPSQSCYPELFLGYPQFAAIWWQHGFMTLYASIFICYNFMAVVLCFMDPLGPHVYALYFTGEHTSL